MMMRKLIGLFVAIAFIAGSTTVYALKLVETVEDNPATDGNRSVTYAKETLLKGDAHTVEASDPDDDATYYKLLRSHIVSAPADITATGSDQEADVYLVSYSLSGMVFSVDLVPADSITVRTAPAIPGVGVDTGTSPAAGSLGRIVSGGKAGDKSVVFRFAGDRDHRRSFQSDRDDG